MRTFGRLSAGIFVVVAALHATPVCQTETLADYIALGVSGCTVDRLAFGNFAFSVIVDNGGAVAVNPSEITVTPEIIGSRLGLNYASSGFGVLTGQSIQYLLTYTIDDPPIIRGRDLQLLTDPPIFPGLAQVESVGCLGAAFSGTTCPTNAILDQIVFDNGQTSHLIDIRNFMPVVTIGDRTIITLDASMGGTASFASFSEDALVPEPRPIALLIVASALLVAGRYRSRS